MSYLRNKKIAQRSPALNGRQALVVPLNNSNYPGDTHAPPASFKIVFPLSDNFLSLL